MNELEERERQLIARDIKAIREMIEAAKTDPTALLVIGLITGFLRKGCDQDGGEEDNFWYPEG